MTTTPATTRGATRQLVELSRDYLVRAWHVLVTGWRVAASVGAWAWRLRVWLVVVVMVADAA